MGAPVKFTCPDIDKAISKIKSASKYADDGKDSTEKGSDLWYLFDYIEDELYGLESMLEDLRNSNSALREWGEGIEDELASTNERINELECEKEIPQ